MTREIIEQILGTEQKAESILQQAKLEAARLQTETDQRIHHLHQDHKTNAQQITADHQLKVENQVQKEIHHLDTTLKQELSVIEQRARQRFPKVKETVLQLLLKEH